MLRLYDMEKEWTAHGSKPRMRGYISIGERVPEVMTTDWKRSKTGLMAMEASLQQNWKSGSCSVGVRSSYGSMMMPNPFWKVATSVAKSAMSMSGEKSCMSVTSSVRSSERSRSATNLRGFASSSSSCESRSKKAIGDSCSTWPMAIRFLRCSTSRRKKATNESARRRLPGTAWWSISSGRTGLAAKSSAPERAPPDASPETSL